ncbi:MAG: hypothetical protein KJ623_03595 [Nanoarchaeota archaeon]|nr:hypothetical protein [Nanoarchaeota archaeon]MBU0962614.1 hypothetical protein [Nanoarchaeota archaeon]
MNFIEKIFENKVDELVHKQFTRFGKGEYERALLTIKKCSRLNIKSSFEFSNDFVELISKEADSEIEISGVILASHEFSVDLKNEYSKRGKIYKAELEKQTITKEKLNEIYEKFKLDHLLLNLNTDNCSLKCKNSLPKPGGKIKDNFCSASFDNVNLAKEFVFETDNFKQAIIKHIFKIEDLIVSKDDEDDFEKSRINAKRKGKIIRIININGKEEKKEKDLLV